VSLCGSAADKANIISGFTKAAAEPQYEIELLGKGGAFPHIERQKPH